MIFKKLKLNFKFYNMNRMKKFLGKKIIKILSIIFKKRQTIILLLETISVTTCDYSYRNVEKNQLGQ